MQETGNSGSAISGDNFPLPGMRPVPSKTEFPSDGVGIVDAFSDHWVSNVFDREQVRSSLEYIIYVVGFFQRIIRAL